MLINSLHEVTSTSVSKGLNAGLAIAAVVIGHILVCVPVILDGYGVHDVEQRMRAHSHQLCGCYLWHQFPNLNPGQLWVTGESIRCIWCAA